MRRYESQEYEKEMSLGGRLFLPAAVLSRPASGWDRHDTSWQL